MTEELDAKLEVKNKVEEDKHQIMHADSDMDNYSQTQNNELEIDEQYDDEIERKMTHYLDAIAAVLYPINQENLENLRRELNIEKHIQTSVEPGQVQEPKNEDEIKEAEDPNLIPKVGILSKIDLNNIETH